MDATRHHFVLVSRRKDTADWLAHALKDEGEIIVCDTSSLDRALQLIDAVGASGRSPTCRLPFRRREPTEGPPYQPDRGRDRHDRLRDPDRVKLACDKLRDYLLHRYPDLFPLTVELEGRVLGEDLPVGPEPDPGAGDARSSVAQAAAAGSRAGSAHVGAARDDWDVVVRK